MRPKRYSSTTWIFGSPFAALRSVDAGLLTLRLSFSVPLVLVHGLPKLAALSDVAPSFPDPLGIGVVPSLLAAGAAEVVGGVLVAAGGMTRLACVPIMGSLAVATWIVNGGQPFLFQEKPFVFLMAYVALFLAGPGRFSVDWLVARRLLSQPDAGAGP